MHTIRVYHKQGGIVATFKSDMHSTAEQKLSKSGYSDGHWLILR